MVMFTVLVDVLRLGGWLVYRARSLEQDRLMSCSLLNVKLLIVRYAKPEDV